MSGFTPEQAWGAQPSAANASGFTPEQAWGANPTPQPKSVGEAHASTFGNLAMGGLKGAADIGATLLQPLDWAYDKVSGNAQPTLGGVITGKQPQTTNEARRASLASFFSDNADPDSLAFKGGDVAAGVAGTSGIGGLAAIPLRSAAVPAAMIARFPSLAGLLPKAASALESGGFRLGSPAATTIAGKAGDMALRAGAGAATGAASASLVNPSADSAEAGAAIGAAMPASLRALYAAGKATYGAASQIKSAAAPFTNPSGVVSDWARRQAAAAGVDPAALSAQLQGAPEFVPGSTPTSAQVAPLPFMVQAEKTIGNTGSGQARLAAIQAENNLARISQLNDVAGTDGTLTAAQGARSAQAAAAYSNAYKQGPNPDLVTPYVKGQWTSLQQRPAIQQAFAQGRQDLLNQGIQLPEGNSPYDPHIVQLADYAKKALDSKISGLYQSGSGEGLAGLQSARDELVGAIDRISPEYQAARESYAAASPPINSMQAGTSIINALSGRAVTTAVPGKLTGAPLITLPAFRSALKQALNGADYGIEPAAQAKLQGIQDDLQRASASSSIRLPGSDTSYNLQAPGWLARQLYGADFNGGGAAKIAGGALGAAGGFMAGHLGGAAAGAAAGAAGMGKLSSMANERVMGALTDAMADPKALAALLSSKSGITMAQRAALLRSRVPGLMGPAQNQYLGLMSSAPRQWLLPGNVNVEQSQ